MTALDELREMVERMIELEASEHPEGDHAV